MNPEQYYQVVKQQNEYLVIDENHNTVIECRDQFNAQHYAELLSRAFYLGYKAGRKDGRKHEP